ncbi:MAG TPA: transglutaminase-like domain-containing protein [Candidatus Obscuribacter sp.]|nr:transglutaminase-like domain-containing protein [Candidatus Obscuribacter sp.]
MSKLLKFAVALAGATTITTTAANTQSGEGTTLPRGVSTANQHRYLVHVKTTLKPKASSEQVRVWHALPVLKPWGRVYRQPPVTGLGYTPRTGKFELEADKRSGHLYYEENAPARQKELVFQTDFELFSADRRFDPNYSNCSFANYKAQDFACVDKTIKVHPQLKTLAASLKQGSDPINYVKKVCDWIRGNITYDDSVGYEASDCASIMKNKRGHCGHIATVFNHLCLAGGVPWRVAWGLALTDAATIKSMGKTTENFPYSHTWGEVYFPGIGWVEVDPVRDRDYFFIPATHIQNNSSFQNAAIWIQDRGGEPHMPRFESGKYEYDAITKISFEER